MHGARTSGRSNHIITLTFDHEGQDRGKGGSDTVTVTVRRALSFYFEPHLHVDSYYDQDYY
jgi:hypothetical protein